MHPSQDPRTTGSMHPSQDPCTTGSMHPSQEPRTTCIHATIHACMQTPSSTWLSFRQQAIYHQHVGDPCMHACTHSIVHTAVSGHRQHGSPPSCHPSGDPTKGQRLTHCVCNMGVAMHHACRSLPAKDAMLHLKASSPRPQAGLAWHDCRERSACYCRGMHATCMEH